MNIKGNFNDKGKMIPGKGDSLYTPLSPLKCRQIHNRTNFRNIFFSKILNFNQGFFLQQQLVN